MKSSTSVERSLSILPLPFLLSSMARACYRASGKLGKTGSLALFCQFCCVSFSGFVQEEHRAHAPVSN